MSNEAPGARISSQTRDSATSDHLLSSAETRKLRRVVDDIPPRLWFVAMIAFFERATFWGITAPWQNYMQNPPGGLVPGALNLGQSMATRIYCAFYIFYYVTPIFFAIISDTRLGRYATLNISVILYAFGRLTLMMTSYPSHVAKTGLTGFVAALVLIGLGGGGFHAILTPFIADQYTKTRPRIKTLKSGERVVTDRALTLTYIYNLYYWVGNIGSLFWFATVFLEKRNFQVAFLLPVFLIIIAMLMLFLGGKWYVKVPHEGNILPKATKILLCASRNGFKMANADPDYILEHRGKAVSWDSQLVNELRRGLKACRVLVAFVTFYLCFDQMQNNLISQAANMEAHVIPNDVMPALNQVACIIFGPLIQSVLYPFLQRHNISFRPMVKITVGFTFIALSMLYTTILQQLIYTAGPCYKHPKFCPGASPDWQDTARFRLPNHINIWIQAPVYIFIAIGEIFAYVTGLEYAYDSSPHGLKAIVQAISLLMAAVGSAGAMGFSPLARDPYLVIFYACLTIAMAVTTVVFWWVFSKYDEYPSDENEDHDLGPYMSSTDTGGASSPNPNQTPMIERDTTPYRFTKEDSPSPGATVPAGGESSQIRLRSMVTGNQRPIESGTGPAKKNEAIARGILETLNTTKQWTPPDNWRLLDTETKPRVVPKPRRSPSNVEAAKTRLHNLGLTFPFSNFLSSTKAPKRRAARSPSAPDLHHGRTTSPTEQSHPQIHRRANSSPVVSLWDHENGYGYIAA